MNGTRWILLALFVSLAVNVFVSGVWVGRLIDDGGWAMGGPMARMDGPPPGPGPRWLRRSIGEAGMPALNETWERHEPIISPLREAVRADRIAVADALAAEPFDLEVYAGALEAMRVSMLQMHTAIHVAMIDLVERLPPDQRLQMAERARVWEEKRKRRKPPQQ